MASLISGKAIKKLLTKGEQSSRIEPGLYKFASQEDERAAHRLEAFLWSLLHQKASIAAFDTEEQHGSATPSPQSTPLTSRSSVARTSSAPIPASVGRSKPSHSVASSAPCSSSLEDTNAGRALHISDACKRFINNIKERVGPGSSQISLPEDLTAKLAVNIVRMVEGEERGVRGCAIIVVLHDGDRKTTLGKVVCDPSCVTHTLLRLHLNRMDNPQASSGDGDKTKHSSKKNVIYISPGYTLEKTRKSRMRRSSGSASHASLNALSNSKSSPGLCRMGSRTYDVY